MNKGIFYNIPKKCKFSTSFASNVKPLVSKEADKYLALAAQANFKKFLPSNIDFEKKIDFLGFAGEAFIANRLNLNDDGVSSEEAIKLAELFPLSFVDFDHNRQKLIGVIVNASYAEFGTGTELSLEDIKKTKSPFSVVLGGIIWKVCNPELADAIEASSNPDSEFYNTQFISWEAGFSEYNLILMDAKKSNFEDGEIISDPDKITELEGKLKSFGGTGFTEEGQRIGRVIKNDVLPIGIGIVSSPAAKVQPIIVSNDSIKITIESAKEEVKDTSLIETPNQDLLALATEKAKENENIISQLDNSNVNTDRIDMKITNLKDITDENLKVIKASSITDFVTDELKKENDKFVAEKLSKETFQSESKAAMDAAKKDLEDAKLELNKVKANLEALQKTIADKTKEDVYSARMAEFDKEYDLDDEDRQVLASQIKDLDDDAFAAFNKNAKVFFKFRKKGAKKDEKEKGKKEEEVKASETKEEVTAVVDNTLDKAKVKTATVPATTSAGQPTMRERYAAAFAEENVLVHTK